MLYTVHHYLNVGDLGLFELVSLIIYLCLIFLIGFLLFPATGETSIRGRQSPTVEGGAAAVVNGAAVAVSDVAVM